MSVPPPADAVTPTATVADAPGSMAPVVQVTTAPPEVHDDESAVAAAALAGASPGGSVMVIVTAPVAVPPVLATPIDSVADLPASSGGSATVGGPRLGGGVVGG
ncbi:MAG: hypothetical protein DLM56_05970, partial [Pseudonocardiales bacterium]